MARVSATSDDEESKRAADAKSGQPPLVAQILVVVAVVVFGDGNLVTKQIAAKTLGRFAYVLGLVSAAAYLVVYWGILGASSLMGAVEDVPGQLRWVWCNRQAIRCQPVIQLFALAALGDALGDVLGYLCTPYVAGPVHALLAQCTTIFTCFLSLCLLGRRYSCMQVTALVVVIAATALGVLPNLTKGDAGPASNSTVENLTLNGTASNATSGKHSVMDKNGTNPFMAFVIGFSCIFNAFAFVTKELVFNGYKSWAEGEPSTQVKTLNIFVANTAESTMQLPFTLMLIPLAQAMGQTNGDPLSHFLVKALACSTLGQQQDEDENGMCQYAPLATFLYIFFNLAWNISILLSVKWNGALATFVALKAVMPTSALLFAYVPWPILDTTPLHPITWVSLSLVLPCIAAFTYASRQQDARAAQGKATCCYPLGQSHEESESTEEGHESLMEEKSQSD